MRVQPRVAGADRILFAYFSSITLGSLFEQGGELPIVKQAMELGTDGIGGFVGRLVPRWPRPNAGVPSGACESVRFGLLGSLLSSRAVRGVHSGKGSAVLSSRLPRETFVEDVWGRQHYRSLPWRHIEDPYGVLVSGRSCLQQTS